MSRDRFPTVAWARYGATGAQLAGSLTLTHRRSRRRSGYTLCGRKIPQPSERGRFSPSEGYVVAQAGRGPCVRCEGAAYAEAAS